MDKIRVKKEELLTRLRKNRKEHREIFLEALEGFRKAAIQAFEKRIELIKQRKKISLHVSLDQPQDMTKEYDRVIEMLEMHLGNDIEVTAKEFRNYVQDDWSWSQSFYTSNSSYSEKAMNKLIED